MARLVRERKVPFWYDHRVQHRHRIAKCLFLGGGSYVVWTFGVHLVLILCISLQGGKLSEDENTKYSTYRANCGGPFFKLAGHQQQSPY